MTYLSVKTRSPPENYFFIQGEMVVHERRVIRLLLSILLIWITSFLTACDYSEPESNRSISNDEKSVVKNRKLIPGFTIPESIPGQPFVSFIALGDQGKGGTSQRHVADLMNNKAEQDQVNFIITLGDNFYNRGVTSVSDKQWDEKFAIMYDLPFLNIPFYATLGNHDHRDGNARYQLEYSNINNKWVMPYYYYTFSKKIDVDNKVQFFALDTNVIKKQTGNYIEQISWLESELRASTASWKIVFGHHPVFSYGKHGDQKQMIDHVRPILEKHNVDVYISGHDHDRQLLKPVGGVYYIISGTGSKSRDTQYGEKTIFVDTNLGFVWCNVSASQFHVQFIDADGVVEFAYTWNKGAVPWQHYEVSEKSG